jgi:predicted transposase/invertase (TIGR01784 family)
MLSEAELMIYDQSLKAYRDNYAALETARYEGKVEGKLEGKVEGKVENTQEIVINLINLGAAVELISQATGLSVEDIEKLK